MSKEKDLFSSILPISKVRRATLTTGPDGKLNLDIDLRITTEIANSIIPNISSVVSDSLGQSINFNSSEQNPFSKIVDYIRYAVVIHTANPREFQPIGAGVRSAVQIKQLIADSQASYADAGYTVPQKGTPFYFVMDQEAGSFTAQSTEALVCYYVNDVYTAQNATYTDAEGNTGDLGSPLKSSEKIDTLLESNHTIQIHGVFSMKEKYLSVSTFCYIDFYDFLGEIPELADLQNSDYAAVANFGSYDILIDNFETTSTGYALLTPDGLQYTGPFHVHINEDGESVYMVGPVHTDQPHDVLTKVSTTTNKIQDFRGYERFEPQPYKPDQTLNNIENILSQTPKIFKGIEREMSKKKSFQGIDNTFIKLYQLSVQNRTLVYGFIEVDQGEILHEKSKLGFLYPFLSARQKSYALWWCDMFRLVEAKLLRRRLTERYTSWNENGFRQRGPFSEDEPEVVVVSNGEKAFQGLDELARGDVSSDYFSAVNLMNPTDDPSGPRFQNKLYDTDNWLQQFSKRNSNIYRRDFNSEEDFIDPDTNEVAFPWRREIAFQDSEPFNNPAMKGVYQYGIELTYEDGLTKYIVELVARMRRLTPTLNSFVSLMNKKSARGETIDILKDLSETFGGGQSYRPFLNDISTSYADASDILRAFYRAGNINNFSLDIDELAMKYGASFETVFRREGNFFGKTVFGGVRYDEDEIDPKFIRNMFLNISPTEDLTTAQQISTFATTFERMATTIADIANISMSLDSNHISEDKSNGGKAPSFIKVRKFFADDVTSSSEKVSGGVVDLRLNNVSSCSILPVGEVSVESPFPQYTPDVLSQAMSLEAVKFGTDTEMDEYLDRDAYFTPNSFFGSDLMDLWKDPSIGTQYSQKTYSSAKRALFASVAEKKTKLRRDQVLASDKIATIQDFRIRVQAQARLDREYEESLAEIDSAYERDLAELRRQQQSGLFADEDFQAIDNFDELGATQKLFLVEMVTRLLKEDRGVFINLDNKTPEDIEELTKQLYKNQTFPGVASAANLLGTELVETSIVAQEQECSALSERQLAALINNQRAELTKDIIERDFQDLNDRFSEDFTNFVSQLSSNTGSPDPSASSETAVSLDTAFVDQAFHEQKRIDDIRTRKQKALKNTQKEIEKFVKKAEVKKIKKVVPMQLEQVAKKKTKYGISEKTGKVNNAVYGNMFALKREKKEILKVGGKKKVVKMIEPVKVSEVKAGLKPGNYKFEKYSNEAIDQSNDFIQEVVEFKVKNPIPPAPPAPPAPPKPPAPTVKSAAAKRAAAKRQAAKKAAPATRKPAKQTVVDKAKAAAKKAAAKKSAAKKTLEKKSNVKRRATTRKPMKPSSSRITPSPTPRKSRSMPSRVKNRY